MAQVEVVLRSVEGPEQRMSLYLEPAPTRLGKRWLEALKKVLGRANLVNEQFCFVGWPGGPRTLASMARDLNQVAREIQQYSDKGGWDRPYTMSPGVPEDGSPISQESLNRLHHDFELLSGQNWNESYYLSSAPKPVEKAIYQLNFFIHEIEALQRNLARRAVDPGSMDLHVYVSFMQKDMAYYKFEEADYENFTYDCQFGDVKCFYSQRGKTHLEAYNDKDEFIDERNISGLQHFNGEFRISFTRGVPKKRVDRGMKPFYRWLKKNGLSVVPGKNYLYDKSGVKQPLGFPNVAKIAPGQFGARSEREIQELIAGYRSIAYLRVYDTEGVTESKYRWPWTDPSFEKALYGGLTLFYPENTRFIPASWSRSDLSSP